MDTLPLWPEEGKPAETKRACKVCGKPLVNWRPKQQCCSNSCAASHRNRIRTRPTKRTQEDLVTLICAHCGGAFTSYKPSQSYCSKPCYTAAQRQRAKWPQARVCPICQTEFWINKNTPDQVYCSRQCIAVSPEVNRARYEKMKGRCVAPHTVQSRGKLSRAHKRLWAELSPEERTERMRPVVEKSLASWTSSLETKVACELDRLGLAYERQKRVSPYFADFYLPEQEAIIKALGCFFHSCPYCGMTNPYRSPDYDAKRKAYIEAKGYKVLYIWGHEIKADAGAAVRRALGL